MKIYVYNGQNFIGFEVTIEMLSHKFGEFAPTRARINMLKQVLEQLKGAELKAKNNYGTKY